LLIVFLPLLGSSVAGFFGRFLGSEGTAIITTTLVSLSSILSLIAFYEVAPGASACYLRISPWISLEMFDASWGFFGDQTLSKVFFYVGGTGEPRELVICVGQRARSTPFFFLMQPFLRFGSQSPIMQKGASLHAIPTIPISLRQAVLINWIR
ncbi:hypothetical protein BHM03_00056605, partial [Ensete ventricosum]